MFKDDYDNDFVDGGGGFCVCIKTMYLIVNKRYASILWLIFYLKMCIVCNSCTCITNMYICIIIEIEKVLKYILYRNYVILK